MNPLPPRIPVRRVIPVALLVMYTPYSWVLFVSHLSNSERWGWIQMWPVLPGIVTAYLSVPVLPQSWRPPWSSMTSYIVGSVLTLLLLALALVGLRRARRAFWPFVAGVSVISGFFGWVAYAMFRA